MNNDVALQTLAAGGVVPPSANPVTELPLDPMVARSFTHPVLGHPVVRVDLEALSLAIDLEMEVLGFGKGSDQGPVAKSPRRAVGFPAAAILRDPANARYALEVVKGFKKAARRCQSKPGFGKEEFDAIGETLGKSVPHFLPSYYEEAARVMLETGNEKYAGQLFEKARVAERVHALEVDETLRENTFVEFALAGVLTIKSLTSYARELADSQAPLEAYQAFRRVCVKRTLGGLPPFGAMGTELKRLAKSAELDVFAEEQALLLELLAAPSLSQASSAFFKPYAKAFAALCKADDAVKDRLLELFPRNGDGNQWLDWLEKVGALAHLKKWPIDRRREFLEKLTGYQLGWRSHRDGRWLQLYIDAIPALKKDNQPFSMAAHSRSMDPDLLHLLLEGGVKVVTGENWTRIEDLEDWVEWLDEPHRGHDLLPLFEDPAMRVHLLAAVDDAMGYHRFVGPALERVGLHKAIDAWLHGVLGAFTTDCGMPDLLPNLKKLENNTYPELWAAYPHHFEQLEALEVGPALHATLQAGIYDELGWKALDDAAATFKEGAEFMLHGIFPYAVFGAGKRVVVLGPDEPIATFDLALPKGATALGFRYVQSELLTMFRPKDSWKSQWVWSHRPNEVFDGHHLEHGVLGVELPDHSLLIGNTRFSAGDKEVSDSLTFTDGTHHWTFSSGYPRVLHEVSDQGKLGRPSRPDFFESWVGDETNLLEQQCFLTQLPAGIEQSPFGQVGRLSGFRLRQRNNDAPQVGPRWEAERLDGARLDADECIHGTDQPRFLIDWPGHDRPLPVVMHWRSSDLRRRDGVRTCVYHEHFRRGSRAYPSFPHWWHYFTPRDLQGSLALRKVSLDACRALVTAGVAAVSTAAIKDDRRVFAFEGTPLADAVRAAVPEVTHPALQRGIGGIAFMAGLDHLRLQALRVGVAAASTEEGGRDPAALAPALADFASITANDTLLAEIEGLDERFADLGKAGSATWKRGTNTLWWVLLDKRAALGFRIGMKGTSDEHRSALTALLRAFAGSSFTSDPSKVRLLQLDAPLTRLAPGDDAFAVTHGGSSYFGYQDYRDIYRVLEHNPTGTFHIPSGTKVKAAFETRYGAGWGTTADLDALLAHEEPFDPADLVATIEAQSGLTPDEALLLAHGLPSHNGHLRPSGTSVKAWGYASQYGQQGTTRRMLLDHAFSAAPEAPWADPEAFARNLAAAWIAHHGHRPAELDTALAEALGADLREDDPYGMLRAFRSESADFLVDATFTITKEAQLTQTPGFSASTPVQVVRLALYLALYAPAGSAALQGVPRAVEACKARLKNPGLWFEVGSFYGDDKDVAAVMALIGGEPVKDADGKPLPKTSLGDGIALLAGRWNNQIVAHPRVLVDRPDVYAALLPRLYSGADWENPVRLLSGPLDRLCETIATSALPPDAYACNPLASVPDLVAEVAGEKGVSEEAAAYWLQLLALPAPRDASVRTWNGWSSKVLKEVGAELVDKGLVIEAKRARAGRSLFVLGGWEDLKAPLLPVETWKLPLYVLHASDDDGPDGSMGFLAPVQPVQDVFRQVWTRVQAGDEPRYEEPGR